MSCICLSSLSLSREMSGQDITLDHECFLPYPLRFIVHYHLNTQRCEGFCLLGYDDAAGKYRLHLQGERLVSPFYRSEDGSHDRGEREALATISPLSGPEYNSGFRVFRPEDGGDVPPERRLNKHHTASSYTKRRHSSLLPT
jgi:hypothetical protein